MSDQQSPPAAGSNSVSREQLKSIIERIEHLNEEKKERTESVAEIYKEAKSNGYHAAALREVIRLRKRDPGELKEHSDLVNLYLDALA